MADELSAELDLSIKDALAQIDDLRDDIEKAIRDSADQFDDDFTKAIKSVPDVEIVADVGNVEPAITDALREVDTALPVTVDADVDTVEPDITAAIAAAETSLPIEADTDAVVPAIDAAVGSATATITVDADTDAAAGELAVLGQGIVTTLAVEADTAPALAQISEIVEGSVTDRQIELGVALDTSQAQDSVSGLGAVSDDAEESIGGAALATDALGTASSLSTGSIDAATNAVGGFLSKMGPVGAATAGSVVALGAFTNQAVSSLGATQRLNTTMGEFADNVENINVGSLSTSLKQLALDTGSSGSAMRNAASDSFQMVTSFGVGEEAASQYSAEVLALAARAVALNPALGETGDVATRLSSALRSGRDKALVPYALGITSVEINSRAAQIAQADMRSDVTQADKAMAGAALASEKLGGSLQHDIAEGAQNPILQVRELTKEFSSATTAIGKPLVAPVLDLLRAALPSVKAIGESIGELAQASLPILVVGLKAVEPVITAFADGLETIGPAGLQVIGVVAALGFAVFKLTDAISTFQTMLTIATTVMEANPFVLIATGLAVAVAALGFFTGGTEEATQAADQLTDAIVDQNGALDENAIQLVADQLGDLKREMTAAGVSTGEYTTALGTASNASKKSLAALKDYAENLLFSSDTNEEFVTTLSKVSPELGTMAAQLVRNGATSSELKEKILQQIQATADAGKAARDNAAAQIEQAKALDFTKEKTDAALQAAKEHKQAQFESMTATQENTLATQTQAAVDAVAIEAARQRALASRDLADAQAGVVAELFTGVQAFKAADDATNGFQLGLVTAAEKADAVQRAVGELNSVLDTYFGKFLSADQAQNAFAQSLDDLAGQLLANGFAFDENSKAGRDNQNVIDELGQKAIDTSTKIYDSTGKIDEARKPLDDFRGSIVKLRDDMHNAGQNTDFLDQIIANVDAAITEVGKRRDGMYAAGATAAGGGPPGMESTKPQYETVGAGLGQSAADQALATIPAWALAGTGLGVTGHTALGNTKFGWLSASSENVGGAIDVVDRAKGPMEGTGKGTGEKGAKGYGEGMGGMKAGASQAVLDSIGTIALAGIEVAGFAAGVGNSVGAAFSAGIAGGITSDSALGGIASAARRAVGAARDAANEAADTESPSKLFRDEVGLPIAQGIAVGIQKGSSGIDRAAADSVNSALAASLGSSSRGGGDTKIAFNISVNGVSDPAVARRVGEQVGNGAADALARRGIAVTARMG